MGDYLELLSSIHSELPLETAQNRADFDRQARTILQTVSKLPKDALLADGGTKPDPLEALDPSLHSLAWLLILSAQTNPTEPLPSAREDINEDFAPGAATWEHALAFLESFDPIQVRYAGLEWRRLVEYLECSAQLFEKPEQAVLPLRTAILRLDPSAGTFTSTHLLFLRLCLQTRSFAQALPLLEKVVHAIPSRYARGVEHRSLCAEHEDSSGFITARSGLSEKIAHYSLQEYYLLGAMVYIGLQKYEKAQQLLEQTLSSPCQDAVTVLMVEAYKKWLIVGCLVEGKRPILPRTISTSSQKTLGATARAYEQLATVFQKRESQRLEAEIDVGSNIWTSDGNAGLVQQLPERMQRFNVISFQQSYGAIPVQWVAQKLGKTATQTDEYLRHLVQIGFLPAVVEQRTIQGSDFAVLRFHNAGISSSRAAADSEEERHRRLLEQASRAEALAELVNMADHRASLSKEYLEHARLRRERAEAAAKGAGADVGAMIDEDIMDTGWDGQNDDDSTMVPGMK